jgi:hypothetical protein
MEAGAIAVGAWLIGEIVATLSHSYANPAIVLAALAVSGPTSVSSSTALSFVAAAIVGALIAFGPVAAKYPSRLAEPPSNR